MSDNHNHTPLISVIIPVYSVENYIHKCVDSIINQDFSDYEIILVDDGSPDKCGVICDKYAEDYSNVRVIHKKNGGLSDARNAGVKVSLGKYIIFLDSDDYVDSDYISTLWDLHKKYGTEMTFSSAIKETEDGQQITRNRNVYSRALSREEAQAMILRGEEIGTSAGGKLINKPICEKYPFPVGKLMEDLRTIYFMLDEVDRVGIITKPTYHYIQHSGSILHNKYNIEDTSEYIELAHHFIDIAPSKKVLNAAFSRLIYISGIMITGAIKEQQKDIYNIIRKSIRTKLKYLLIQKDISLTKKIRAFVYSSPGPVVRLFTKIID